MFAYIGMALTSFLFATALFGLYVALDLPKDVYFSDDCYPVFNLIGSVSISGRGRGGIRGFVLGVRARQLASQSRRRSPSISAGRWFRLMTN